MFYNILSIILLQEEISEKLEDIIWDDEEDLELPANFTEYENECRPRTKGKPKLYRSEENLVYSPYACWSL
jgi:hypothetical protein